MNWPEMQTKVRARWGKLTDEDLSRINGKYDKLTSTLAERYGWAKEQAERQVKEFEQTTGVKFEGSFPQPAGLGVSPAEDDDEEEEEVSSKGKKSGQRK